MTAHVEGELLRCLLASAAPQLGEEKVLEQEDVQGRSDHLADAWIGPSLEMRELDHCVPP